MRYSWPFLLAVTNDFSLLVFRSSTPSNIIIIITNHHQQLIPFQFNFLCHVILNAFNHIIIKTSKKHIKRWMNGVNVPWCDGDVQNVTFTFTFVVVVVNTRYMMLCESKVLLWCIQYFAIMWTIYSQADTRLNKHLNSGCFCSFFVVVVVIFLNHRIWPTKIQGYLSWFMRRAMMRARMQF